MRTSQERRPVSTHGCLRPSGDALHLLVQGRCPRALWVPLHYRVRGLVNGVVEFLHRLELHSPQLFSHVHRSCRKSNLSVFRSNQSQYDDLIGRQIPQRLQTTCPLGVVLELDGHQCLGYTGIPQNIRNSYPHRGH